MQAIEFEIDQFPYADLVVRYGDHEAKLILKALERFEGIREELVATLSEEERLQNVFRLMSENLHYQTRH